MIGLVVDSDGNILSSVSLNSPYVSIKEGNQLIVIEDEFTWEKVKDKPGYYKVQNGVLKERSDQEKVDYDKKNILPNNLLSDRLTAIESKVKNLESKSK